MPLGKAYPKKASTEHESLHIKSRVENIVDVPIVFVNRQVFFISLYTDSILMQFMCRESDNVTV